MKMGIEELRSIVANEERGAIGYLGGALSEERKKSYKYYLGEPFGNEIEGRSQVVSTDVADVVEWILPSLIRVFESGDDVVEFQPQGPEDEEMAKQASEYCNWIFTRDNPGFVTLYEMLKDALLARTGIAKVFWDPTPQYKTERYYNIPDDSFAFLKQAEESGEIEIVSDETKPDPTFQGMSPDGGGIPSPPVGQQGPSPATGDTPPSAPILHDVVIQKTTQSGCTRVMSVPPEEFLISRNARTVKEAVYIGHRRLRTQSSLIEDGYDEDSVKSLSAGEIDFNSESIARNLDIEEQRIGNPGASSDNSTREIWVTESYILVDYNGDGIAERLKVTTAGAGTTTILEKGGKPDIEEWEGPVPFAVITPILMPHRVIGRSIADITMDLQLIKSVIMRQALDNLYLANDPRSVVNPEAVELDDLLDSRPGGLIRTKNGMAPADVLVPFATPFVAEAAFPMLEYLDSVRENRTGITKYNQGLDANDLNKTASGITQIMTAAQQRIELIARVCAETGIKHLFKLILYNVCRYQDKPRTIRLRNKWIPMDPREWDEEMDVTINVGIGTGNRDQILSHLALLGQAQNQIVLAQQGPGGPIVTYNEIWKLATKVAENAGFKNPEQFFADPRQAPPQPPKPDPDMVKAQGQLQIQAMKAQADQRLDQQKAQNDAQATQAEVQARQEALSMEAQLEAGNLQMKKEIAEAELVSKHNLALLKMRQEHELAMQELANKNAIAQATVEMQERVAKQKAKSADGRR